MERALEEVRRRGEESLRNVEALAVKVGKQADALATGVAVAAEAAADRLRREAETTAIQVAEDIRRRLIGEIGRLRDAALADLEGRTAETIGRLRGDLWQFEERWQRDFTELLVQLQETTTVLPANEEELTWVEILVRRFLRWIGKLK